MRCNLPGGTVQLIHHRPSLAIGLAAVCFVITLSWTYQRSLDSGRYDFSYIFVAGRCWLAGQSPYDVAAFEARWQRLCTVENLAGTDASQERWNRFNAGSQFSFVYPPWSAVVAVPLALLPPYLAFRVIDLILIGCLVALALAYGHAVRRGANRTFDLADACMVGAVPLVGGATTMFRLGQTGLIAITALAGLIFITSRKRRGAIAIFLILAAFKPTLSAAALVYFMITSGGRNTFYAVAGLLAVALAAIAFTSGWPAFVEQYAHVQHLHNTYGPNQPQNFYCIPALLTSSVFWGTVPTIFAIAWLGLGASLALIDARRPPLIARRLRDVAVIAAAALLVCPLQQYDLALLILVLIGLATVRRPLARLALLGLVTAAGRHVNLRIWLEAHLDLQWPPVASTLMFCLVLMAAIAVRLHRPLPQPAATG